MISKLNRLMCSIGVALALGMACLPQSAAAQETPNVLMTIDGMTMLHAGLFRNNPVVDGYNTFQFGPVLFAAGQQGRFKSFFFVKNGTGDGGISHNARMHSDSPEAWGGTAYVPIPSTDLGADGIDNTAFPVTDRVTGGQLFDPSQYQIEVKFKPNIGVAGLPSNTAPLFTVGLDQVDGHVWDAQTGSYKRGNDAFTYNIGAAATPINDWYASAPKDADGYATWTVPVSTPNFIQRGFYYAFGDGPFRTNEVLTGNGKMFNETTMVWDDVNDGLDTLSFGGGAVGPPPQLKLPNGVPLISFGGPAAETGLSIQLKHISLKKINPGTLVSRIDANSGITFRFGSGFTYGTTQPAINVDGIPFQPIATDQISRFDQNGMTNLTFNMRTPDNANEAHRFVLRGGPSAEMFNGETATVNIRAKLLPSNTATTLTIVAKDLDGNDNAPGTGADEYTHSIPLNSFNTSTFTTISIPLNSFVLSTFVPSANQTPPNHVNSTGPFGFQNPGDGSKLEFNLYEFAGLVPANTGLLRMEMEFMEIRLPPTNIPGDHNLDGTVDAADYVAWRKNPSAFGGDPTGYNVWRANFGESSGSGGSAAVPEPAAWLLMSLAAAFIGLGRQRGY